MLVVIGGMIGLGKTSVGEILATELSGKMYYESVDDNPILPLFYSASTEEIERNRYPFLLQLYFLNSRFKTIKDAALNSLTSYSIVDRSIYEDWYFAKINHDLGRINALEFKIYKDLLDNMMQEMKGIPKKAPDLMIYLEGSFETVLKRINKRGRDFELDPHLISYYKTLWSDYTSWINNFYNASEIFVVNMDKYDIVNNANDRIEVIKNIKNKMNEIKNKGKTK